MNKNIYQKIHYIQAQLQAGIIKTHQNRFQNYWYFNESGILKKLKPLLEACGLVLLINDVITPESPLTKEKIDKEWFVSYQKQALIINKDNPEEKITLNFWAMAQNTDLAKAKGSAETYSIKYFLQKLFLIPANNNDDPDRRG